MSGEFDGLTPRYPKNESFTSVSGQVDVRQQVVDIICLSMGRCATGLRTCWVFLFFALCPVLSCVVFGGSSYTVLITGVSGVAPIVCVLLYVNQINFIQSGH